MARLPQPGSDGGVWGDVLNDYLSQAHNADGSLKDIPQSKVTNLQSALAAKADTSAIPTTPGQVGAEPSGLSSTTRTSLDASYISRGDWADVTIDALGTLAPPVNTPTITYSAGTTTAMTSPVEYRPVVCGTGSQTTSWNGQSDTNFRFHPGNFSTASGANGDLALLGVLKPGGAPQAARWPIIVEFETSSGVNALEVVVYGAGDIAFKLEVNGMPAISDNVLYGPTGLGTGKKALLTFPDARVRRIRLYISGGSGFYGVRVPTGQSITKPTITRRTGVFIGDSFVNGSGNVTNLEPGASQFDTFALRILKALGASDLMLAGIGGTGWVAGASNPTPAHYQSRVAEVMAANPNFLIIYGSSNDGPFDYATVRAAVETLLDSTAAVTERYVVGPIRSGYPTQRDAVRDAAAAKGVPFIDMLGFIDATGGGTIQNPNSARNGSIFLVSDGTHPTFAGHRAIERAMFRKIAAFIPTV